MKTFYEGHRTGLAKFHFDVQVFLLEFVYENKNFGAPKIFTTVKLLLASL